MVNIKNFQNFVFTFFKCSHKVNVIISKTMKTLALGIFILGVFMSEITPRHKEELSTYTFNQKITMTITSLNEDPIQVNYYFSSQNKAMYCMRINGEEGASDGIYFIITENKIDMLMNATGNKMRKTITEEEFNSLGNQHNIPEQADITKTGNKKAILGYMCEEHTITTTEGTYTAWVCPSFPIDSNFIPMVGTRLKSPFNGFMMELNTAASAEKVNLKITAVDLNTKLAINTTDYKEFKF